MERLTRLLKTIDKTIAKLTEDEMALTDKELYEGFSEEQIERGVARIAEFVRANTRPPRK